MRRLSLVALVALACLALAPVAGAKFGMALVLGKGSPRAGAPFTVSLRTDVDLPPDHELRLIAVAPGRIRSEVLGTITASTGDPTARVPVDGFEVTLVRVRPDRWRGVVSLPRKGRWQLVVPNWGPEGYAIPPPLVRFVVVR